MIDKNHSRNPYHAINEPPRFLRSVCLYMDMLGYKEMWWQAEREGSQVTFLHRLYEALEKGQDWLFPNDSDVWPTGIDMQSKRLQTIS